MLDGYGVALEIYVMQQVNAVSLSQARATMVSGHERYVKITVRPKTLNDGRKVLFDTDIFCVCLGLIRHNYLRYSGIITGVVLDVFTGVYCVSQGTG